VNQVMDILDRPKKMIAVRSAPEIEEVWNLQDVLDVVMGRIGLENDVSISSGPAIFGPQRIYQQELGGDEIVPRFIAVTDASFTIQPVAGIEFLSLSDWSFVQ